MLCLSPSWARQDRLDIVGVDGTVSAVVADEVATVKFPAVMGNHTMMNVTMKDGSVRRIPVAEFLRVDFTPENDSEQMAVTATADWNTRMEVSARSERMGQTVTADVWAEVPAVVSVYGDLTGKEYSGREGFLASDVMGEGMVRYSFAMPFEPVTVRCREYYPTLYNGVKMPLEWPPVASDHNSSKPMEVPYLTERPEVCPVDVGRQLFVDDFLIESTDLTRSFHKPVKYEGNPILSAVPSDMTAKTPGATAKDGGVWWEPREGLYKMWYEAGWYGKMALATSKDGLNWSRPDMEGGSNIIPSLADIRCNSSSVVLDYDAPDAERYKLFMRSPNATATDYRGWSMVSPDGVNWSGRTKTGTCGDKSTMFYNPFRRRWVYSIRSVYLEEEPHGRARYYHEHPDFLAGAKWGDDEPVFWCQSDELDNPDPEFRREPQLYNLNAVAYESLMLGMIQILIDENDVALNEERPKYTMLETGFSRDGFHWDRPCRDYFIECTRTKGTWDRGYVQSVGGICGVSGDELRIYYIGFAGEGENKTASNGATGVAVMRRDGFASMDAGENGGTLLTRILTSSQGAYLFVNASCGGSSLRAEILDAEGNPLPGYTAAECRVFSDDSTIAMLGWENGDRLPADVVTSGVRIRFHLGAGASLYSFWLSPSENGESMGYVGAGGPGFTSNIDDKGKLAYPSGR